MRTAHCQPPALRRAYPNQVASRPAPRTAHRPPRHVGTAPPRRRPRPHAATPRRLEPPLACLLAWSGWRPEPPRAELEAQSSRAARALPQAAATQPSPVVQPSSRCPTTPRPDGSTPGPEAGAPEHRRRPPHTCTSPSRLERREAGATARRGRAGPPVAGRAKLRRCGAWRPRGQSSRETCTWPIFARSRSALGLLETTRWYHHHRSLIC
jgi:hypothetical protein